MSAGADLAADRPLRDPLPHAGDPDARTPVRRVAAVVEHLAVQARLVGAEPDHDGGRTRVPDDVGQRLGGDPVDRLLDGRRQRRKSAGLDHCPQGSPVRSPVDQVRPDAQRLHEPQRVEGW